MQDATTRRDRTLDRRTLLRRAGLIPAGTGVALPLGTAHAQAHADAVQHVSPSGDDTADGLTPATARRSWQRAIDALPESGGVLAVAAGVHQASAPVAIRGKAVNVAATPGAVLRATAPMDALLTYDRLVDAPGAGVQGLTLDLAGLAQRGLLILDCWQTEHTLRVVGLGAGTAVHIRTERADFGCYYNRIRVKCVGQIGGDGRRAPGSTGVHIEGPANRNRTNHNTVVDSRLGNVETGILVGAYTDANTVVRTDCTACGVGYAPGATLVSDGRAAASGLDKFRYLMVAPPASTKRSGSSLGPAPERLTGRRSTVLERVLPRPSTAASAVSREPLSRRARSDNRLPMAFSPAVSELD